MLTNVIFRTLVDRCKFVVAKDAKGGILFIDLEGTAAKMANFITTS